MFENRRDVIGGLENRRDVIGRDVIGGLENRRDVTGGLQRTAGGVQDTTEGVNGGSAETRTKWLTHHVPQEWTGNSSGGSDSALSIHGRREDAGTAGSARVVHYTREDTGTAAGRTMDGATTNGKDV